MAPPYRQRLISYDVKSLDREWSSGLRITLEAHIRRLMPSTSGNSLSTTTSSAQHFRPHQSTPTSPPPAPLRNMKLTLAALAALLGTAQAGNLCLAGTFHPSKADMHKLYVFAAGSPCEDGKKMDYDINVDNICSDHLPFGINICGQNGNLVKLGDDKPPTKFGCAIGFETGGTVYEGTVQEYNPYDGNAQKGPCDAECGIYTGIDGFLQFEGVPLGFCS
ncbi:hypothetical protein CC79DRAFT_216671 [Sarocladium strictum]